jgi:hypothetical protein
MQNDLYTKAVLTVIALALSAIALQNFIPLAHAQNYPIKLEEMSKAPIQRVMICDLANCANVNNGALRVGNK